MKWHLYRHWNTLYYPFDDHSKIYSFNILPKLEICYETAGFYIFGGGNDREYCKELSISFCFLMVEFHLKFWWDFYSLD